MYILGIGCYYHDSSASLLKDGKIVAAAQEERFTRKKHDSSFPINAIKWCLESQGITVDDLEYVTFYEKPFLKFERLLSQHIEAFPRSLKTFLHSTPSWINEKLRVTSAIKKRLKYKGDILYIEHHLAHAAATFLLSPFKEAAIVTVDGVGEWSTTTVGVGKDNDIHLIKHIEFPHSLGLLYSAITAYLGFSVNNSEYKVMGLAPYGKMDRKKNEYYKRLLKVIDLKDDGSYHLDMSYFVYHHADRMPSKKLCALLEGPVRTPETQLTQRHKDIAAAVQLVYEDAMIKILRHAHEITSCKDVVLSGGCGLNSVFNGKILRTTPFTGIWIQPDAGDGGTSMGAAAYAYHTLLGKRRTSPFTDAYTGPKFSADEIERFLKKNRIRYTKLKSGQEVVKTAARLIHNDNVIGWFMEGMEWGPRALG
ncbi:TPA: hypothetical protein HA251_03570, partial [Candidatus Woesearchaeota archaeon]|nr:hypothetical protein [Candidatus Woesearchaeota archaeon]